MNVPTDFADLHTTAGVVLSWLGQALLYGTVLAGLTWVMLKTVFRRARPALHALFWLVVLLKFMLPVGPGWSLSLASLGEAVTAPWTVSERATPPVPVAEGQTHLTWIPLSPAAAPAAPPIEKARFPWGLLLCAAYAAGVLFIASFRLGGFFTLVVQCRRLPVAPASIRRVVEDVCHRLGVRRTPQVRLSEETAAPFLLGTPRPMIVLSRRQLVRPDELEAVVLHEVAHLRRGDMLVRYLQWLAGTLMFFWPVVAWVNRRIDLVREHACDEWALRHGRLSAGEYARCLLGALHPAEGSRLAYQPAAMAANLRTIERRIDMILDAPTRRRHLGPLGLPALLLLLAWGGFALTGAVVADELEPQEDDKAVATKIIVKEHCNVTAESVDEDGATVTLEVIGEDGEVLIKKIKRDGVHVEVDEEVLEGEQKFIFIGKGVGSDSSPGKMQILADRLKCHIQADEGHVKRHLVITNAQDGEEGQVFIAMLDAHVDLEAFAEAHPTADVDGDDEVSGAERVAYLAALAMSDPEAVLEEYPYADRDENGELEPSEAVHLAHGFIMYRTSELPDTVSDELGDMEPPALWLPENVSYVPTTDEVAEYLEAAERGVPEAPLIWIGEPHSAHGLHEIHELHDAEGNVGVWSGLKNLHLDGDVNLQWLHDSDDGKRIIIQEGDSPVHILRSMETEEEGTATYLLNLEDGEHTKVIEMRIQRDADGDEEDVEIEVEIVEEDDEAL